MIRIVKNRVFDGKKTYEVGDTIESLTKKEEKRLVEDGIAEFVEMTAAEDKDPTENKTDNENTIGGTEESSSEGDKNLFNVNPDEVIEDGKTSSKATK